MHKLDRVFIKNNTIFILNSIISYKNFKYKIKILTWFDQLFFMMPFQPELGWSVFKLLVRSAVFRCRAPLQK